MRWPVAEAVVAGVASGVTLGLLLLPPSPYLAPWLRLPTQGIAACWLLARLAILDNALLRWRSWHTTPAWEITTDEVLKKGGWS
jgi:hypothetical protein